MIFESTFGNLLVFGVTLATIFIAYFKWSFQYWARRGVPYLEPTIPFGSTSNPFKRIEGTGFRIKRFYNTAKDNGWKFLGVYSMTTPHLVVTDLDQLRNIMTKDFEFFTDRGIYYNEEADPLSGHLFNLGGKRWKNLRVKLSPTFTSGKMKMMFQTLLDCSPGLLKKIEKDVVDKAPIDIKESIACFTTDIIGSCAFGLDFNSFKDENSPFRMYGKKFFNFDKYRMYTSLICMNFPRIARLFGLKMTPTDVINFFVKLVEDTVEYREKNGSPRKDFMQLLVDIKNNKLDGSEGYHDGTTLTMREIAAQSFVFFVAGFETSSTTSTFALFEIANDQQLQEKLRSEINTVLAQHDGQITYEAIHQMKFMDQVVNETLRKYPPVPSLTRKCVKDYKVPDEDITIEKNTIIDIPILGIHHDNAIYPDPEKFDPERFSEENKNKRHNYAFIPFGEGPRLCIGMRFGLMQTKVGITCLLKNYKLTVNQKTKLPLKIKPTSFIPVVEGDVWLSAEKL